MALASGTTQSPILVGDVVQRVKCEISDAFDDKLEDPRFSWLRNWTVTTDLTLQANLGGGLSGSGNHTDFFSNIANKVTGGNIAQNFIFGASANVTETATRSDVLSFSLSLWELHDWRVNLDRDEAEHHVPVERLTCNPGGRRELVGHLGLKEWVDAALNPVANRYLWAGDHPSVGGGKAGGKGPSKPSKSKGGGGGPQLEGVREVKLAEVENLRDQLDALEYIDSVTSSRSNTCDSLVRGLQPLDGKIQGAVKAFGETADEANAYGQTLAGYYHTWIKNGQSKLSSDAALLKEQEQIVQGKCHDLKTKSDGLSAIKDKIKSLTEEVNTKLAAIDDDERGSYKTYIEENAQNDKSDDKKYARLSVVLEKTDRGYLDTLDDVRTASYEAAVAADKIARVSPDLDVFATFGTPDPPLTAISHAVQFEVNYGAGISPSWMLGLWRGPALSCNLVSANGTRFNLLNLAVGPRNEPIKIGDEQKRLLNYQTLLLTRQNF